MARPRAYESDQVVHAARELFWAHGYEATSLSDLENHTGLNRSSLYQAFGSKRALFDEALGSYLREVVGPRMAGLERADAGLAEVVEYLRLLGDALRVDPVMSARGCLMVNTIVELAGRDPAARGSGRAYPDRIAAALAHALNGAGRRGEIEPDRAAARARILTAAVIGVLVTARLDPTEAADLARSLAEEVAGWRAPPGDPAPASAPGAAVPG